MSSNYYVTDDYGGSAGPVGGQSGGFSGEQLSPQFSAATIGQAVTVAYLFSSIFQRPVRLVPVGSPPPYTLVVGIGANTALTGVPSGTGF